MYFILFSLAALCYPIAAIFAVVSNVLNRARFCFCGTKDCLQTGQEAVFIGKFVFPKMICSELYPADCSWRVCEVSKSQQEIKVKMDTRNSGTVREMYSDTLSTFCFSQTSARRKKKKVSDFNGFKVMRGSCNFRLPSVCLKYFTSCLFFVKVCIYRRPLGVGGKFMIYHMF